METVSLRELRGAHLRATARSGKLLAITNHKALVAVVVPVAAPWVEHLVDHNWSHVRQSIAEGEQAVASAERMTTLGDVTARATKPGAAEDAGELEAGSGEIPERIVIPLAAPAAGRTVVRSVRGREVVDRLRAAVSSPGQETAAPSSPVVSVRIGDLTARLIEQVSQAGQLITLTHERELIGLVVPITPSLVEFLIEQNLPRVVYNVVLGEKELGQAGRLDTLGDILGDIPDGPALS